MNRADAERRRQGRRSSEESGVVREETEEDGGGTSGVALVALLVAVGGLSDLAAGVVTAQILPVAVVFVALGATKL